jgi:hypothetical protein
MTTIALRPDVLASNKNSRALDKITVIADRLAQDGMKVRLQGRKDKNGNIELYFKPGRRSLKEYLTWNKKMKAYDHLTNLLGNELKSATQELAYFQEALQEATKKGDKSEINTAAGARGVAIKRLEKADKAFKAYQTFTEAKRFKSITPQDLKELLEPLT